MKAQDRPLNWAFVIALLLHGLALGCAARLPAAPAGDQDLDQIRVFDKTAPMAASAVDLVEWPAAVQEAPAPLPTPPEVAPAPPQRKAALEPTPRPLARERRHNDDPMRVDPIRVTGDQREDRLNRGPHNTDLGWLDDPLGHHTIPVRL